jgi:hypothetical protein
VWGTKLRKNGVWAKRKLKKICCYFATANNQTGAATIGWFGGRLNWIEL